VVTEVAKAIGLENLKAEHIRAEQVPGKFSFVVSRAVTQLKDFYPWVKDKFNKESKNEFPNGILYLKGGDLEQEIAESKLAVQQFNLSDYFNEEFFETKKIIYVKAGR
jgi:16S rRNA (guanine527-N7)-methyltransferase